MKLPWDKAARNNGHGEQGQDWSAGTTGDHNLGDLDWQHPEAPMPGWARDFADWMRERLEAHDLPALLDWERQAPNARHAHPTVEHLMPLFVALGAAGESPAVRTLHRSHEFGSLALDAFAFD